MDAADKTVTAATMASAGLPAALGAIATSSCCALPLALSLAGAGGTWLGSLGVLLPFRPLLLMAAALVLAIGWSVALGRCPPADCAPGKGCAPASLRQDRAVLGVLGLATMLLAAAAAWDWIEPAAQAALLELVWRPA